MRRATEVGVVKPSRITTLRAPNPSPMTLDGTNTYLIDAGRGAGIVIDPGPRIERHVEAILASARERGLRIAAILVTHGHPDHAPAALPLATQTGAPVYAHAAARFEHDRALRDRERLEIEEIAILALDTPGHARDHLCFWLPAEAALFTGDVIVGRGTVVIAPPAGNMRAYLATLRRLREDFPDARSLHGGHGDLVDNPRAKIDEYLAHRAAREAQLLATLAQGPQTLASLVNRMYADLSHLLRPAAARQILAHLIALEEEGRVASRDLKRSADIDERAILMPDLSTVMEPQDVAVARAELGLDEEQAVLEYTLVEQPHPHT